MLRCTLNSLPLHRMVRSEYLEFSRMLLSAVARFSWCMSIWRSSIGAKGLLVGAGGSLLGSLVPLGRFLMCDAWTELSLLKMDVDYK